MKRFTSEIPSTPEGEKFAGFSALNKAIEDQELSLEEAVASYHSALLNIVPDGEKQAIDWQIKYLIEELKVAVNQIHEFITFKFSGLEGSIRDIIRESVIMSHEVPELVNSFLTLITSDKSTILEANIFGKDGSSITKKTLKLSPLETKEKKIEEVREFIKNLEKQLSGKTYGISFGFGEVI